MVVRVNEHLRCYTRYFLLCKTPVYQALRPAGHGGQHEVNGRLNGKRLNLRGDGLKASRHAKYHVRPAPEGRGEHVRNHPPDIWHAGHRPCESREEHGDRSHEKKQHQHGLPLRYGAGPGE